MSTINIGVVGTGLLGSRHARVFAEQPNARLVAVADIDIARAEAVAAPHKAAAFASLEQMLERAQLDAIAIATPDHLHHEPLMQALAAGKHVFLEKPIDTDLARARAMAAATHASGKVVAVNFSQRWLTDYAWIKRTIEAGDIGEVRMVNSLKWDTLFVPTTMLKWAAHSSPFYFMSSHDIDLVCWYLGRRPLEVLARDTRGVLDARGVPVHDGINVLISFETGIAANYHSSWIHPNTHPVAADGSMQIIGTRGAIFYNNRLRRIEWNDGRGGQEIQFTGPATANEVQGKLEGAFTESVREFLACIREAREPSTSPRRVLVTSEIQAAAMDALRTRGPVTLTG